MLNRRCVNEYNSLADVHLQAYFSNRHLLRHLRKVGLINKKREIVPESTYRANINRAEQKREVKEALAQAIVHKSLDLQLKRESEIQKRLEEIAKLELVKKMRSERQLHRPSVTPSSRAASGQHPAWKYFTLYPNKQDSFPASRPRTAHARQSIRDSTPNTDSSTWTFGNASERRQFNLKTSVTSVESGSYIDSYSDSTTMSVPESDLQIRHARGDAGNRSHQRKPSRFPPKKHGPHLKKNDREELKMSPYLDAVPSTEKRFLKISEVPSGARKTYHPPDSMANKRTNCLVTLQYLGTGSYISWDEASPGTEVVIHQQHCGGNTVCVYRGQHIAREEFSFISHRHLNFPFSLSIYLSGILHLRVSACCEYRHRKGTRLGGPQGLFSLVNVKGASPCARCQLNRKMTEEKKKKVRTGCSKATEDGQMKVDSTMSLSPAEGTESIEENKEETERENNEKKSENEEELTQSEHKESQHNPIEFAVSGTVIDVEESESEQDDDSSDYQEDFEDEEGQKKDEEVRGDTGDKEQEVEEVVEIKEVDDASDETSSTVSEEEVPSEKAEGVEEEEGEEGEEDEEEEDEGEEDEEEEDEEEEDEEEEEEDDRKEKEDNRKEEEAKEVVEIKDPEDDDDDTDETSSTKSGEKAQSEGDDDYEDDFNKDDEAEEKNKEPGDTENKANNQNYALESLSLDQGRKEKDTETTEPDDNTENAEDKKDKVEDLKNEEKEQNTNSMPASEKIAESHTKESDSDGPSDPSSSKESSNSSSPLPTPRRKSKIKAERRFRANNRKTAALSSSSSDSDSIAHLPAELEGTEKAKNWIPASQQQTI